MYVYMLGVHVKCKSICLFGIALQFTGLKGIPNKPISFDMI